MSLSLREKRRQQTARDIQRATLELAVRHGLDNVTTEEIAAAAGVSTRTFFNYYVNKEAAAIGTPPAFREADKQALQEGTGPLADDLKLFLDRHMETLAADTSVLKMIGKVLRTNEKARGILEGYMHQERRALTECLGSRVSDRQAAAALACIASDAVRRAIFLWERQEGMSLGAALDATWQGVMSSARILVSPSDRH